MVAAIFPPVPERGLYHDRLTQIKERNGYSGVIDMSTSLYAQECHSVERSVEELHQYIAEVLSAFVEGYEMRKSSYAAQLKRMREVSNNATRNAIQTCKMDATAALNHLKTSLDKEKEKEFHEIKRQLREAELNNGKFVNELASVRAQLETEQTQVQEQNYKMERITNEFVKSAEAAQGKHLAQRVEDQAKFEAQLVKEKASLKAEHDERCRTLTTENENQMLAQERHFGEIRQMLTDKLREKEEDIVELKESVQSVTKQLAVEHDNYNRNLADEQLKHDNAIKLVHAENLRATALLKADIAAKIQQLKADEQQREDELDLFVTKEKEKLVSAHVCELELYEHNSKQEMKRLQQHMENKQKEEFIKIKYMHELELTRALRENDRLNKLLIRATGSGGGGGSSNVDSEDFTDNRRGSGSQRFGTSSEVSSRKDQPPPPPTTQPPPQSHRVATGPGTTRVNKWDALNKSLVRDHDYLNSRSDQSTRNAVARNDNNGTSVSDNVPPPDSFAVEDALAHTSVGRDRNPKHVTASMGKVNSYMSKLQSYLEDYQDSPGGNSVGDASISSRGDISAPAAFGVTGSREDIERAMADAAAADDEVSTADSLEDLPCANTTTYFSPDTTKADGNVNAKSKSTVPAIAPRLSSFTTVPATSDVSSVHNMTNHLLGTSINNSHSISLSSDAQNLLGSSSALSGANSDSDDGSFHLN